MGSLQGEPLDWGITWGTGPNKTTISIQTALVGRGFSLLEQNWHHAMHGKAAWREPGFVPWEMGSLFLGRPGSEEGSRARDQQQSRREPWAPGCVRWPQDGSGKGSDPGWVFLVFFKKTRTQQDSMLRSCAVQVRKLYHGALEKTHLFLWELMNKIINCLRVALKSSGADVGVFLCVCVCLGRCKGVCVCVCVCVWGRCRGVCTCVCVWGRCRGVCVCDL